MKRKTAGISIAILLIVAAICTWLFFGDLKSSVEHMQTSQEEFYAPTYITDSIVHINITERACVLIDASTDTMVITSHNAEMMKYDNATHKFIATGHSSEDKVLVGNTYYEKYIVREYDLDTILRHVPENFVFGH